MTAPLHIGRSAHDLTSAQNYVLWQLAQHKYGWGYIAGVGRRSAARALERRGLLDICAEYRCTLTTEGDREVARRWPQSPAALDTYDRPDGGWDAP